MCRKSKCIHADSPKTMNPPSHAPVLGLVALQSLPVAVWPPGTTRQAAGVVHTNPCSQLFRTKWLLGPPSWGKARQPGQSAKKLKILHCLTTIYNSHLGPRKVTRSEHADTQYITQFYNTTEASWCGKHDKVRA